MHIFAYMYMYINKDNNKKSPNSEEVNLHILSEKQHYYKELYNLEYYANIVYGLGTEIILNTADR
jgi:hypothetical protein